MARSSIKLTDATRLLHPHHVYPQLGQITTHEGCDHFTQDFSHFSKTHLTPYNNNKQEEILYIYEATSWLLGKFCVDNHFVDLVYLFAFQKFPQGLKIHPVSFNKLCGVVLDVEQCKHLWENIMTG